MLQSPKNESLPTADSFEKDTNLNSSFQKTRCKSVSLENISKTENLLQTGRKRLSSDDKMKNRRKTVGSGENNSELMNLFKRFPSVNFDRKSDTEEFSIQKSRTETSIPTPELVHESDLENGNRIGLKKNSTIESLPTESFSSAEPFTKNTNLNNNFQKNQRRSASLENISRNETLQQTARKRLSSDDKMKDRRKTIGTDENNNELMNLFKRFPSVNFEKKSDMDECSKEKSSSEKNVSTLELVSTTSSSAVHGNLDTCNEKEDSIVLQGSSIKPVNEFGSSEVDSFDKDTKLSVDIENELRKSASMENITQNEYAPQTGRKRLSSDDKMKSRRKTVGSDENNSELMDLFKKFPSVKLEKDPVTGSCTGNTGSGKNLDKSLNNASLSPTKTKSHSKLNVPESPSSFETNVSLKENIIDKKENVVSVDKPVLVKDVLAKFSKSPPQVKKKPKPEPKPKPIQQGPSGNVNELIKQNSSAQEINLSKPSEIEKVEEKSCAVHAEESLLSHAKEGPLVHAEENPLVHEEETLVQAKDESLSHGKGKSSVHIEEKPFGHNEENILQQAGKESLLQAEEKPLEHTEEKPFEHTEEKSFAHVEEKPLVYTGEMQLSHAEEKLGHVGEEPLVNAEVRPLVHDDKAKVQESNQSIGFKQPDGNEPNKSNISDENLTKTSTTDNSEKEIQKKEGKTFPDFNLVEAQNTTLSNQTLCAEIPMEGLLTEFDSLECVPSTLTTEEEVVIRSDILQSPSAQKLIKLQIIDTVTNSSFTQSASCIKAEDKEHNRISEGQQSKELVSYQLIHTFKESVYPSKIIDKDVSVPLGSFSTFEITELVAGCVKEVRV
jgi:hypothetical protein